MLHHHHTDERFAAAHADVDALLQRLGRDVTTLQDGDNPANRQALADAGERYETAEALLGKAQSVSELLVARGIAVEGLQCTRAVRTRQGLDPGPDPEPAPSAEAPQEEHHSWAETLHSRGGLGSALGAGAAGGLLGLIGGAVLGGAMGEGGDFGGGGDWGGGDYGGGDWGGD
jgi:hypothetical protein